MDENQIQDNINAQNKARQDRLDKEVPSRLEKDRKGAEDQLIGDRRHGMDETGKSAPNQIDQAKINREKREKMEKGEDISDPRWPHSSNMRMLASEDNEAKEMNKDYQKSREEASNKEGMHNPTMGQALGGAHDRNAPAAEDKK